MKAHEIQTGDLVLNLQSAEDQQGFYLVVSNNEINSVIAGIPMRLVVWTYFCFGQTPITYEVRIGPRTSFELLSRTLGQ